MCGIVGIACQEPGRVDRELVAAMRDTMTHRGPDDAGLWLSDDGKVCLAQRRLAIIDLSPGGHQPMTDRQGRFCITFNGEIYNYRDLRSELEGRGCVFRTRSDTEVVLEAWGMWGPAALSRLNGMFALALYDLEARSCLLARDRAGEKPLFYTHAAGRLIFASELKALMAHPDVARRLDPEALEFYFTYGYVPGDRCILTNVRKLRAGQALQYSVERDHIRTWDYWRLPEPPARGDANIDDLTDELASLLRDAVRRQLVADVPVGILLSGGIDSSLVTAMAADVADTPVKTFTIAFPGHRDFDEGPFARLVADHFGTSHTELVAEPSSVELLPLLAKQYDEPIADSSIVPTFLVSRLIRDHATVALGGDGGDELFGGYPHYSWLLQHDTVRRYVPRAVRQGFGAVAAHLIPVGVRGRNYLIGASEDRQRSIAHVNVYFDATTRHRLLAPMYTSGRGIPKSDTEGYRAGLCTPGHSLLRQATEADFRTTMVDGYLVKVDRASMLNSLEVRAPWLDYRLVEFAFGRVPDRFKATTRERKILPRRLAARLLPAALDLRRKQGFTMPLASWFGGNWGSFVQDVLENADCGLFDRRVIVELLKGQRRGLANTPRLFALTMFELWRREYQVAL